MAVASPGEADRHAHEAREQHEHDRLSRETIRAIVVILLSLFVVGISYGAIAHALGLPTWLTVAMALIVMAGSSEILFVGLLTAGAAPLLAALAGILVNTRNFAYGVHAGTFLPKRWTRLLAAQVANDESAAVAVGETTVARRRRAFWLAGGGVAVTWTSSSFLGTLVGDVIPDTRALGLDAALPALFFALIVEQLRQDRVARIAALIGGSLAAGVTPLLPAGLGALAGLGGLAVTPLLERHGTDAPRSECAGDDGCPRNDNSATGANA